ncbi:glycogen/starch/alpha-glucan phosphorylase [Radiobacillus sp. PE A8.2]|uniref:glycogen/starch/alpha-glucan phosphorylase n=1 Tax=Radiobacillus sp. PE A8.2 TaxID=3380349 RepID=UPI0038900323
MFTNKEAFKQAFLERLVSMHGKGVQQSTLSDRYYTLSSMVREYISTTWVETNDYYKENGAKQVYYLSMEFLLGKLLKQNLMYVGKYSLCSEALSELGIDIHELEEQESDPALGNGGLGRLAADFMDSLASLNFAGHGCGIRYKYGLFEQKIVDGYQVEVPDYWLQEGNAWEVRKSDRSFQIRFGGKVNITEQAGEIIVEHVDYEPVLAVAYDMPMVGYQNSTINTLRLWNAESMVKDMNLTELSKQGYHHAMEYKRRTEAISEFLYPDDSTPEGKALRLKQQYFLVSASLQSIVARFKRLHDDMKSLPEYIAIHTNDTHPVLAIPELMRILMDEEHLGWEEAWEITTNTISFTNHTILAEALETWSIDLFQSLLPRIYLITEEINERFCKQLWIRYPDDWDKIRNLAIVADHQVKMVNLAVVGSHHVNGVSKLHSNILQKELLKDFANYFPQKFSNKTNGISHRRWLLMANPRLTESISETIGTSWISNPNELRSLKAYKDDHSLQDLLADVKKHNKHKLASWIQKETGITVDPSSLFDVHVKRIHAYKRQLLNIFHIIDLYHRLKENTTTLSVPRTFIFAGKAAPSYHLAKNIIKLINALAKVINHDKSINDQLKVIFIKNYGVSIAEKIIPAADVSEQISTASKEASGTGNMKFMMNGALTIGTHDGANIEMAEKIGEDNIFLFGLKPDEVLRYYANGQYNVRDVYEEDNRLKYIMDQLMYGLFSRERADFQSIYYSLLNHDEYFVLKDFACYVETQNKVAHTYTNQQEWQRKSIINIAQSGYFSSDRTINEYTEDIWKI